MAKNKKPATAVLGDRLEADILFYSGLIYSSPVHEFVRIIRDKQKSNRCLFILRTYGGDPDGAYKIARQLQRKYDHIILLIESVCKSAGTLVALAANEIVMTDISELGPLDVQVQNPEEVGEYASGLVAMQALTLLQSESMNLFLDHFDKLHHREGFPFPTKLAAKTAAEHTTGLFRPIYSQLDPNRLGEIQRAMLMGLEYGKRLVAKHSNADAKTVYKLVGSYPSHGFVIDREEAETLFCRVRKLSNEEIAAVGELQDRLRIGQIRGQKPQHDLVYAYSPAKKADEKAGQGEKNDTNK